MISITSIVYIPLMAFAKYSLLIFYYNLSKLVWFRRACWVLGALITGYSVAMALALIFACNPLARN